MSLHLQQAPGAGGTGLFGRSWSSTLVSGLCAGTAGAGAEGLVPCGAAPSPERSWELSLLRLSEGSCWMEGEGAAIFSNRPASLPAAPARFKGRRPTPPGTPARLDRDAVAGHGSSSPASPAPGCPQPCQQYPRDTGAHPRNPGTRCNSP